jgi:tape measure domain-containing protein
MVTQIEYLLGANLLNGGTMSGVKIRVSADTSQARNDLGKLEKSLGRLESVTRSVGRSIQAAAGAYSAFFTTKAFVNVSDDFQSLNNQLKIVQKSGENLTGTLAKLNQLSIQSRTTLTTTVTNYSRLSRALDTANLSQQDFLDVTEAINKAAKLGGQPLATQEAALFQLSQAFSSGVLRGEEFNSVSEGAPEILRALTKSLGVTRGELREMAFDGQITSEVLTDSLLKALPDLRREFNTLTPLVSELSIIMGQEFRRALNELDRIGGISASVANKVQLLTTAFSFVADEASYYFTLARSSITSFQLDVFDVVNSVKDLFTSFFSDGFSAETFLSNLDATRTAVSDFFNDQSLKVPEDSFLGKLMAGMPLFSVAGIIGGTGEALSQISNFAKSIVDKFFEIYDEVILNSSWSGLFWKGVDRIGGPKLTAGLQEAFGKISNWAETVKDIFSGIFESITGFGQNISSSVEDFLLGVKQPQPDARGPNNTPRVGGLLQDFSSTAEAFVSTVSEFLSSNKFTLAGVAIGVGILTYMDSELRSSLFQGLFLGLGYAIAIGFLAVVTSPIGILIGAIIFGPNVLNTLNETGLTKEIGKRLAEGIVGFFKSGEGTSTFQRIIDAILATAEEFGEGLLEGFNLQDSFVSALIGDDLTEKLVGGLALAFAAVTITGILKNGILGAAGKIFGFLFKFVTGAAVISALGRAFGNAEGDLPNSRILSFATAVGRIFRGGFRAAVAEAIVGGLADAILSADGELTKVEEQASDAISFAAGGATLGATVGSVFPVIGTALGAAIGGAGGLLVGIFKSPELQAAINDWGDDLGRKVKNAFVSVFESGGELIQALGGWYMDVQNGIEDAFVTAMTTAFDKFKAFFKGFNPFASEDTPSDASSGDKGPIDFTSAESFQNSVNPEDYVSPMATGGKVTGSGGPTSDSIPAMLSNGEYVIKASSVSKFGPEFMNAINSGILPRGLNEGGAANPALERLYGKEATLSDMIANRRSEAVRFERADQPDQKARVDADIARLSAELLRVRGAISGLSGEAAGAGTGAPLGTGKGAPLGTGKGDKDKDKVSLGFQYAERFKSDFASGFSEALKTGDFKSFGNMLLDSFTSNVIDSFAQGFTDQLFSSLLGKKGAEGPLAGFFNKNIGLGDTAASVVKSPTGEEAKGIANSIKGAFSEEGGVLSSLKTTFGGLFSSLGSSLSGLFSGLSGGFGSVIGGIGKFFGFSEGGLVPRLAGASSSRDSIPAMLTPGELVVPKNNIDDFMKNSGNKTSTVQSFNINVTGDVTRQTRQEIIKMIPQITSGVNSTNKETRFRGR